MHDRAKFPWIAGGVRLTREVATRLDEEALAAYGRDEECCGFLAGPAADPLLVDAIVPMENRANKLHALDPETYPRTGRTYFDIDPMKFDREVQRRASAGAPVKVVYHSHLDVGAYFSETDAAAALGGGATPTYPVVHVVTSVQSGVVKDRKLFVWDDAARGFVPAPFSTE